MASRTGTRWSGAYDRFPTATGFDGMVLKAKAPAQIRLRGVLPGNQREDLRRFEVERGVSGGFVVRALIVVRYHPLRANRRDSPFVELQ